MSGFARRVGMVATVVAGAALIGTGIGAALGGTMVLSGVGSAASIASVAGAVAAVSGAVAQVTAKKPSAEGAVIGFLTGANQPLPYLIGEAYTEGVEIYRNGYGGEVNDVKNPYAFIPRVLSCCGPIESMGTTLVNYETTSFTGALGTVQEASGYYEEYLYHDQQLGARPESDALASPSGWGTPGKWGSDYKLSGFAAVGWSLIWSKKGKRFGGGQIPPLGKVPQGVKVYDPRLDSTYPGGSGTQRIDDETTWAYSTNPALHALAYSYGRLMNGKPIFGVRLFDADAIDLAAVVAWANVCDANSWGANGTIYEPGDKWNNLKKICEAGAAQPVPGSTLGFDYQAPRTSLYTVTLDDLAGPVSASLGRGWKARHNVLVPRYRSAAHQWGYVQADRVEVSAWITADGEEKIDERQFDLVTDVDQVTELATYDLYQRREAGPIVLPCKPHMREFHPGHCLTLAAELGAHPDGEVDVVIRRRAPDANTGVIRFICELETPAKHTAALGLTGGAPPTITWPTNEDIQTAFDLNSIGAGELGALITGRAMVDVDPADGLLQASDTEITVENHTAEYFDKSESITGTTITTEDDGTTAIAAETRYFIYYDDAGRSGGAVTLKATQDITAAVNSATNPGRHYVGAITTDVLGGGGTTGGGTAPPYVAPGDWTYEP
ncbi:MAG: hypothetical protein CL955_06855 [Erythrobacteraceae bacterium]|nr:hypothetical protein [Erythrobacteraceae bacterium]